MFFDLSYHRQAARVFDPFNLPATTEMAFATVPNLAFGIGISYLLFALDTILLDKMPRQAMVRDALVFTNLTRMATIADLNVDTKAQEPPAPSVTAKPEGKK